MNLLDQIKSILAQDKLYKKCSDSIIVVLEYTENTKHTERRRHINFDNAHFAKFRASELKVIDILDFKTNQKLTTYEHSWQKNSKTTEIFQIQYIVGEIIRPINGFETDINKICAAGIHYFKSLDAAFYYGEMPENYSGQWRTSNSDGSRLSRKIYENGKMIAHYNSNDRKLKTIDWKLQKVEEYFHDGVLMEMYEFKNVPTKRHGEYQRFLASGKLVTRGKYKYNERNGEWEYYFMNGNIESIGNYCSGKKRGQWKYFDENENIVMTRHYISGIAKISSKSSKISIQNSNIQTP